MTNPLSRLKSICDGATSGKWFTDELVYVWNNANCEVMIAMARGVGAGLSDEQQARNLKLIAESKTAMPLLIEIIEKQCEALEKVGDDMCLYCGEDLEHSDDCVVFKALTETAKLLERIGE